MDEIFLGFQSVKTCQKQTYRLLSWNSTDENPGTTDVQRTGAIECSVLGSCGLHITYDEETCVVTKA